MKSFLEDVSIFILAIWIILTAFFTAAHFSDARKLEEVCLKETEVCEWQPYTLTIHWEDNDSDKRQSFCYGKNRCLKFDGVNGRATVIPEERVCHQVCTEKILARRVK